MFVNAPIPTVNIHLHFLLLFSHSFFLNMGCLAFSALRLDFRTVVLQWTLASSSPALALPLPHLAPLLFLRRLSGPLSCRPRPSNPIARRPNDTSCYWMSHQSEWYMPTLSPVNIHLTYGQSQIVVVWASGVGLIIIYLPYTVIFFRSRYATTV